MSMNPLIESLVVEDEALMRRTVIKRLEASPVGFQVVGEAKNGREALKLIRLLQPKVVFATFICRSWTVWNWPGFCKWNFLRSGW